MIFTDFLNLRDTLSDKALTANGFASLVAGLSSQVDTDLQYQFQGFDFSYNKLQDKIRIYDGAHELLNEISPNNMAAFITENLPETDYNVSDSFETVSSSGDLYSALGLITQKFSYSNRISLTDINYQIDQVSFSRSASYDVEDLKRQLLSLSNTDGYVTNKSWLLLMSDWIKECRDGAEDEVLELDNTKPSVLSGLYTIVSTVIENTLSGIFTAMSLTFGSIVFLLRQAFAKLFEVITTAISASGHINFDAVNNFVKGPCIAREETITGSINELVNVLGDTKHVDYVQLPSCGLFFWKNSDGSAIRLNSYWSPTHTKEGISAFTSEFDFPATISGHTITKNTTIRSHINFPQATDAENELMASDIAYYSECLCVSEFVRWLTSTLNYTYDSTTSNPHLQTINWNVPVPGSTWTFPTNPWIRAVVVGWICVNGGRSYLTDTQVIDSANELVQAGYASRDNWTGMSPESYTTSLGNFSGTNMYVYKNPLITYTQYSLYYGDSAFTGLNFKTNVDLPNYANVIAYGWYTYAGTTYFEADSLPTEFLAEYSGVSSEVLTRAIIITSMAAVVFSFTALKVSKAIRLKKLGKSLKHQKEINEAKKKYDDWSNPDRQGGAKTPKEIKQALNEYTLAVDKYNRRGRILGWGSYDINNGWFNSPDAGSSTVSSNTGLLDVFQNTQDFTKSLKEQITGESEDPVSIASIDSLIRSIRGTDDTVTLSQIYAVVASISSRLGYVDNQNE